MLIPRFSVRWMLLLTACCAVFAFVVSLAVAGHVWAIALSVTLASTALIFTLYALFFLVAWAGATWWGKVVGRRPAASPFASHTAPPHWVPPEEPD